MAEDKTEVYQGRVEEVFSGDDLIVMLDLGVDSLYKKVRVRLDGVDTPNAIRATPDTSAGHVRTYVANLVRNQKMTFEITSRTKNSWVAKAIIHLKGRDFDLNEDLIGKGFGFIDTARTKAA